MNAIELLDIISTGETSKVQFKERMPHAESISQEIVAMSNSLGGDILMGIKDVTGEVIGLTHIEVEEYDRVISQIADNIKPTVYLTTEVVKVADNNTSKNVLVVHINNGINKPYKTARGEIYVKQGSNKRLLTDNAEIMRLFQNSGNLLADEMEVNGTSINDIDEMKFSEYFKKEFNKTFEEKGISFEQALKAKMVLRNHQLSLAGLLFFGKAPQSKKPAFTIKAVSYFGNDIGGNQYRSKPSDLTGTIPELFEKAMNFLKGNLKNIQSSGGFNSIGKLEVSEIALVELVQNALVHRDYFKNSPIRLIIFDNRIEIISPGKLPNSLTVEDIKNGNPVIRNNQLVAFSSHTLPYSGMGSGVKRSMDEQPNIELINDIEGEQFIVKIPRPKIMANSISERQQVSLKAGVAFDIFVKGGINYYDTVFHLRFPASANGKSISLVLKKSNGQEVSQPILLEGSQIDFQFQADIESMNIDSDFDFLQLISKEDLTLEIWPEKMEGGFF